MYVGPDIESLPVYVYSVTTDSAKGLLLTNAKVKNRSQRDVSGIKFRWLVSTPDEPDKVLLEGQSKLVSMAFLPGESKSINFSALKSPFSFAKIHTPLLRDGTLSGDFRVEILVDEVLFGDGSAWKWAQ